MRHKSFRYSIFLCCGLIVSGVDLNGAEGKARGPKPATVPTKPAAAKPKAKLVAPAPKQLTSGVVDDRSPCWSPDGKLIAFQRDWQVWVMNADGSGQRQLTKGPHKSGFPTWSPDGKLIAFHSNRRSGLDVSKGGNWDLWLMDKDGELAKLIAGDKGNEEFPYWSPDGQKLSFHYRRMGPGHEVYVIDLDGKELAHPTIGERDDVFPMWSPDGKSFALASAEPGMLGKASAIVVMDIETGKRTALTDGRFSAMRPCWSPDGHTIAFQSNRAGNEDIWSVNVATKKLTQLTRSPADEREPWWSPDGKRIAYSAAGDKGSHICILTLGELAEKP